MLPSREVVTARKRNQRTPNEPVAPLECVVPKKDPADSAAEIAATLAGLEGCPDHYTDRAQSGGRQAGGWLTVRSREVPRHWRPLANSPRRVRGDRPGRPFAERPR